ncbi:MAG: septation protein IspZ [Alphaproteobacteria bacterium]|nr:septation protein IspZ [Alphaproteobacteria bacterium]MBU1515488.1 septation protein IspZ [Alphaproteobacteria bacterium]MBU2095486.1 septation protein IspZ [Alphaproteobacteria bacterium]MBU2150727.1 septation protein IspZ [Alphaproteobacteria bacterium]MBU2306992.1 septation protein IspZ [Alphaproteobacteria bacterium]
MGNLIHAGRALGTDLLPTLVFAVLVALKVDVVMATAASIAVGAAQIAIMKLRRQDISRLQWASLALVLVFGTAAILAHDARFLMAKPTVIYAIIGLVMLQKGWMLRYLPPMAGEHATAPMIAFGYVWAGLMFVTAAANLVVAILFPAAWPAFLAIFPLVSKIALFAIQYLTVRHLAIRSARAAGATEEQIQAAMTQAA